MKERTGGELIQDFLQTFELPYVFGNPGTTETTFLAAISASKATYVLALHESSAVGIAAGYALMTGKPSVVSLHTYPGLPNGMVQYAQCPHSRSTAAGGQWSAGFALPHSQPRPGCPEHTARRDRDKVFLRSHQRRSCDRSRAVADSDASAALARSRIPWKQDSVGHSGTTRKGHRPLGRIRASAFRQPQCLKRSTAEVHLATLGCPIADLRGPRLSAPIREVRERPLLEFLEVAARASLRPFMSRKSN